MGGTNDQEDIFPFRNEIIIPERPKSANPLLLVPRTPVLSTSLNTNKPNEQPTSLKLDKSLSHQQQKTIRSIQQDIRDFKETSGQTCAVWAILERDRRKGRVINKNKANPNTNMSFISDSPSPSISPSSPSQEQQQSLGECWTNLPKHFLEHFDL
ncbi:MAG: hypothetical protein EZS28_054539, partial [Streblomastix strix]